MDYEKDQGHPKPDTQGVLEIDWIHDCMKEEEEGFGEGGAIKGSTLSEK